MFFLYNFFVLVSELVLKIIAFFSPKIKLFIDGRKDVFKTLKTQIQKNDNTIWFHAASLGEYEQGLPVIEAVKLKFPNHKIILTFFSPSGFEVRKNNAVADLTCYLPLDTISNARAFIKIVNPKLVFFIKYEFWPNYLNELKKQNIKTYLISGIFREKQVFFKWYGSFYRARLNTFTHFFVQNENSKKLLQQLNYQNVTVSGDTRFDRVKKIAAQNNTLAFINQFKNNTVTVVAGSSWEKDEELLISFINKTASNTKFIIAPHNIKNDQIVALKSKIEKKTVLFSEKSDHKLEDYQVFIVDTIGILTKIYSYADIAYVGGGFGNPGVHNVLEPAVFGIPIIIGPNYSHFDEATDLVSKKGCVSVSNQTQLDGNLDNLISNESLRIKFGIICKNYVDELSGATEAIVQKLNF